MTIKNNTKIIMAKKDIDSITELMEKTGLSRSTLNKLYHNNEVETIKLENLIQICSSLKIKLSDLIEYTPD